MLKIRNFNRFLPNTGLFLSMCAATLLPGIAAAQVYQMSGGLVSVEAEHGSISSGWGTAMYPPDYSGSGFLSASAPAALVQFPINFDGAGSYKVYVRGMGGTVTVSVDGSSVDVVNSGGYFIWSSSASSITATAGLHTVQVTSSSPAFGFDKIVLSSSGIDTSGMGPGESASGSAAPAPAAPAPAPAPTPAPAPAPAPVYAPAAPVAPAASTGKPAGAVSVMKMAGPPFDSYINSNSSWTEQFLQSHIQRMVVFAPYFNAATSWYGNGLMYADSYAIYSGGTFDENIAATHPEWILKDQWGNNLFIPWGCGGGTCPQYAADFSNPGYRQWWISKVRERLAAGNYKGVFVDDVNFDWRVGDGWGNAVTPWDRNTNAPMSVDNWRRYFAEFLESVRQGLPNYEICHNSIWYAGGDSGRDANQYIQRQISAANYVFIEFGINDGGLSGGTGDWSVDAVLRYIEHVNALGRHAVVGMIAGGNAGDRAALEFAVGGYLLVNDGGNYVADAYDNLVIDPNNWWAGFDVNLGAATSGRYSWNGLMRRDFSGGMVLVNYPDAPWVTVNLPEPLRRTDGVVVNSVTLGPRQAAILSR